MFARELGRRLMLWFVTMQILSMVLECLSLWRKTDREKDLEILLLRRRLDSGDRARIKPLRVSRVEKLTLAVLAAQLKSTTGQPVKQFSAILRIFQPATVFKWHWELVRRKWTFRSGRQRGRPRTSQAIERLVVRLARENRDWGNLRIAGELAKLGIEMSDETVANILRQHGITRAPERGGSPGWRQLMDHYRDQLLACDFFTLDTLFLQIYVFFFIKLGSRRVHFAGCTEHPTSTRVNQQARQVVRNPRCCQALPDL